MKIYELSEADIKQLQEWGFEPDEINDANRKVYTYEDWLNPDRSMGLFPFGGGGIKAHYLTEKGDSTTKGNGKLTLFILPESEGQKIEQRKGEIVEGFVVAYFEALTSWFESQYEKSLEKKILTEKELKKVEKLLFEWNEDYQYHSYGEGFWLSFHTYASRKAGSMCDWYERFCVNGDDPKSAVSRKHATMTANELNSPHPETLHYVVAALAFHRFKTYLKDKLEREDVVELSFEDWQTGSENWRFVDFRPSEYPINRPFERHLSRGKDGQYRLYSLSDPEYQKIAAYRNDIFDRQVGIFIQGQIEGFEKRYSTSLERETLLKTELEKVNDWLKNKELSSAYVFPNPNGGTIIFSDLMGLARKEGEDANLFPYWYNELIVQGKDARTYIEPKYEYDGNLPYPIAVHVLYRYKIFLENRMEAGRRKPVKRQAGPMEIPSKTLALWCFYRESKGEYPELEGMNRKQIAEKIAKEYGLSSNHFRQDLSAMKSKETRLVRENIPRIHQVIEMLADFPKSLQYAQDELKILQIKNE